MRFQTSMRRVGVAVVFAVASAADAQAQTTPASSQAEVLSVVEKMFDAMRAKDTVAFRASMHPNARIVTTRPAPDGGTAVRPTPIDDFIRLIGGAAEKLDEQIANSEVRVDDQIATVWTPYYFYVGGRFSHCGFDSFHLLRTAEGWKIIQVADTQRRGPERCGREPGTSPIDEPKPTRADSTAIVAALQTLFDAMRARDTAAIRAAAHPDARFNPTGNGQTRQSDVTLFNAQIAGINEPPEERMVKPEVRIHDNLATIWTWYDFHIGGRFSHCGTDAAQLVKTAQGWKVLHISWNGRQQPCAEP